jgi:exopolyphosphatase/guanosine-5'-triphosphate,3'-diphosphate pyrophosphatase
MAHAMRCACVDIGTNTTRLLVAEPDGAGSLREVAALRHFLRLGTRRAGPLGPETVARVAEAVAAQTRIAQRHGADRVRVVATAAVRSAANADELCAAVRAASGAEVDVLTDAEEARLAFAGATRTLAEAPAGVVGVVDVGGGSSELVAGTLAGGVTWWASFPLGSGVLAERHLRSDPPTAAELAGAQEEVAALLGEVEAPRPAVAIAVGGGAASLARVVGPELSRAALAGALEILGSLPASDAARRFGVHVERVRLLPAGLVLLQGAAEVFGRPLCIGRGGLREGVVLAELAEPPPE